MQLRLNRYNFRCFPWQFNISYCIYYFSIRARFILWHRAPVCTGTALAEASWSSAANWTFAAVRNYLRQARNLPGEPKLRDRRRRAEASRPSSTIRGKPGTSPASRSFVDLHGEHEPPRQAEAPRRAGPSRLLANLRGEHELSRQAATFASITTLASNEPTSSWQTPTSTCMSSTCIMQAPRWPLPSTSKRRLLINYKSPILIPKDLRSDKELILPPNFAKVMLLRVPNLAPGRKVKRKSYSTCPTTSILWQELAFSMISINKR